MSPTVLVIEDEPDIRELIRINLEHDGYEVILAADGAKGLAAVGERLPDVIVLDVMMPNVDGWEVLSELKVASGAAAEVPVLMLTARVRKIDRLRGGIYGALFYLSKPFSAPQLRETVSDALNGGPEPARRRRVQQQSLAELARLERSESGGSLEQPSTARPRLTRLESAAPARVRPTPTATLGSQLPKLSPKQQELLIVVGSTTTVSEAAECLSVSRSNVYASLRRIARRLEVHSVSALVHAARDGGIG